MGENVWCVVNSQVSHLWFLIPSTGDVVYVEFMGQPFMVLGSANAIDDLLERRSAVYSNRGRAVMVAELYVLMVPGGYTKANRLNRLRVVWDLDFPSLACPKARNGENGERHFIRFLRRAR